MLHALGRADQGEIRRSVLLVLTFLHDLLAFFNQSHHAFAWLGPGTDAKKGKTLIDTLNLFLRFHHMLLEQFPQLVKASSFSHLWQSFRELFLGVKDIAKLVNEKLIYTCRRRRRRALRLDDRIDRAGRIS